jgi:hypothetical protein
LWGSYEGSSVGEAHLRQVQDRPPPRRGAGDLSESEAQAAAGMIDLRFHDFMIDSWIAKS